MLKVFGERAMVVGPHPPSSPDPGRSSRGVKLGEVVQGDLLDRLLRGSWKKEIPQSCYTDGAHAAGYD
ncbi:hypothetical protein GW17_00033138 [Ensete ventricosum]|nr:hypothetical protein GW17_00033138 [Ensete ventricosum]